MNPRRWPWWVQCLAVYAAARLFSAVALLVVAGHQVANGWTGASPGYADYTGLMWDATWYRQIAEGGYPDTLPVGTDGQVVQNAWAFFPLFPLLARGVMELTGGSWAVVAPTLALLLGAAAMPVIHRLIERGAPRAVAARPGLPLATVLLVSVFPTSVVLQVGYTESLALLLIALTLLAIVTRHYGWAAAGVLALGLTRAVALPIAAVVLVHAWLRWRERRTLPARTWWALGGLAVAAAVSGVLWPVICGWVTGVPDGYLQTQGAWRGSRDIAPFGAWGYILPFWFGDAWPWIGLGIVVVIAVVLLAPSTRRLGGELWTWAAAYPLYLCAAIEPGSSLARFLLLAFPLGAATVGVLPRPVRAARLWTGGVAVVMLGLQLVWLWQIWRFVPPAGWPP
ncbi:hypothetical protein [Cellulomonas denverensis]|uniref:Integral membrane protein n=1 Tax=Cellulomonas denverensis TaxID=264297 RepID=A0A7X6KSU4_9CELL|nr:hypothetical protein [Cellulomonas denverensis]NKY21125.1 hypothetical protein [Cellulomonas denverensis]